MSATPRAAAAALIRACAATIVPEVVAEATAGGRKATDIELQRRLTAFLERRIPLWVQALEADDLERATAIRRLLRTDDDAGEQIPPVVLLGTVAIGYRLIESVMRTRAAEYGFPHEALWAEMDLLRRTVSETRRRSSNGAGAA